MAANVFYSVCPFGTGNLLTGGSPTIVIDGSGNATLTLGGATQVDNIGIGVAVSYNSITSYISEITDATHFKLVSAVGVTASSQTSTAVTSINHEYASLSAFEAGFTDSNHINSTSLVSADVNVYACCYYDHVDNTADTSDFTISFGSTSNTQRFKIYVPNGGTESINVQRSETGVFDTNKYYLDIATPNSLGAIYIRQDNVDIFGLQLAMASTVTSKGALALNGNSESSGVGLSNIIDCILRDSGSTQAVRGIYTVNSVGVLSIENTIIHDFDPSVSRGILIGHAGTYNITNVAIYNCNVGVGISAGTVSIKNSLVFGNVVDLYGTITATYCATDDTVSGTGNFVITQTASDYAALVTDAPNGDFSITDSSSELYNAGTNTGAPATDIIGTERPQATTTDIGAFELIVTSGVTVDATKGSITVAGYNPTLSTAITISATKGSINISGLNPNIAIGTGITSTLGLISISAFNPSISVGTGITATTGQATISSLNPSLSIGTDIDVTAGSLTVSGLNPKVSTGVLVSATVGAINITGLNTSISEGIDVDVTAGAITVTGLNASVQTGLTIEPNTGLISITGFNPSISAGTDINATLGAVSISGLNALVDFGAVVSCTSGNVNITGRNPSISAATTINVTQGLIGITGLKTNIALDTDIAVTVGTIGITGLNPTLTISTLIETNLGLISILGYNPNVTVAGFVAAPIKRTFAIPYENRTFAIPCENRVFTIN